MTLGQDEREALDSRQGAALSFESSRKDAESATMADIAYVRQTLGMASLVSTHERPREWVHRLALFNRAWSILVSSLQLARSRVPKDSFTLLRTALEAAAVGLQVSQDTQAYTKYVTGNFSAPKSIGPSAKAIPHFGKVYGILSQYAVHTNVRAHGPLASGGGTLSVYLFREEFDPRDDEVALAFVSLVSSLVFRAAELALFEPATSKEGWLQTFGGTHLVGQLAQGLVNKKYAHLESLLQSAAQPDDATDRATPDR